MRKMQFGRLIVMIFSVVFATGNVFAQNQEGAAATKSTSTPAKIKERKAVLNFEDELVEGATQKPELFYLFQKKNFNYKRLIKLRENFLPEMRKTTEDIQRVRSVN